MRTKLIIRLSGKARQVFKLIKLMAERNGDLTIGEILKKGEDKQCRKS